jgi:DNA-binding transcriptional MocR family regulator
MRPPLAEAWRLVFSLRRALRPVRYAPATTSPVPSTETAATCSSRTSAPSAIATGGRKYTVTDARVEPTRPTSVVKPTKATAVPRQPSAATASTLDHANEESGRLASAIGASSTRATISARQIWLRSVRSALAAMPDHDLDYGDPRGAEPLRTALAEYLGRVRGVVADPEHLVITSGFVQARGLVCRALAAAGAKRVAIEDPSHPEQRMTIAQAGLEPVPIAVDEAGIRVEALERAAVDAVVLTPAHQFPTGAVLAGDRRTALLAWLRSHGAIAIEDDYDVEYRYDRTQAVARTGHPELQHRDR